MTACRAPKYAELAEANGWTVELAEHDAHVDLELVTTWRDPDTDEGWEIGLTLRWYANEGRRGTTWRLAALDGRNGRTVAGVARRLTDDRELELWLGGLNVLERYIQDPADLAAWLDEQANQQGATT